MALRTLRNLRALKNWTIIIKDQGATISAGWAHEGAIGDSYYSCYGLNSENKQDLAGFSERSSLRGVGVFRGF